MNMYLGVLPEYVYPSVAAKTSRDKISPFNKPEPKKNVLSAIVTAKTPHNIFLLFF